MSPKPTNLDANRTTKELTLTWSDGHTSTYTFSLLRAACPCVECRGGHEKMSGTPDPGAFNAPETDTPATRIKDITATGTYAISIFWEDGHDAGIYNWEYLRKLCSCENCRGA